MGLDCLGEKLSEGETIASSAWDIPLTFSGTLTAIDTTLQIDGISYSNANGILLSPDGSSNGIYRIKNRITTSSGRDFERSIDIWVRDL